MKPNVNIVAVGDIMFGEMPGNNGNGIDSFLKKNGFDGAFQFVERYFVETDLVFGNIEAVLDKKPRFLNVKESSLIASPLAIQSIKKINLKIAHVANNHILDHGIESFIKSIKLLEDNGANIIGSVYENKINAIIEIDDIKFNFIGVSIAIDGNHNKDYYFRTDNIDDILKAVNNTKHLADHTIVSIHWGNEHINLPNPKQIEFAHQLIDNGVSLILGHHPHCYQGIEKYQIVQKDYNLINVNLVTNSDYKKDTGLDIIKLIKEKETDWEVKINFMDTIETTKSGKFKFIFNEILLND